MNEMKHVAPEQEKAVKGLGFLKDKTAPGCFNGRVITRNGKLTAAELKAIAEGAERFGNGQVTLTARMTAEIQKVPYENIEPLRAFLAERGLETGGTGKKVRPVVSCKGTTCQYGLIDTFELSEELHRRFYQGCRDLELPHKFKIAVGGCPNNCVKPDLNDLGVIGQWAPVVDGEKCRGCRVCQVVKACPIGASELRDGLLRVDGTACNRCGRCVGKCPFGAVEDRVEGYGIYIGGRWGKQTARGRMLDKLFTDRDEVIAVVGRAIELFRTEGAPGERFADTVARLGFDTVQRKLLNGEERA